MLSLVDVVFDDGQGAFEENGGLVRGGNEMTNQPYILIIAPPNELAARVNERWADYALWHAPFVVGGNICQAMVRREDDNVTVALPGRNYVQTYNAEPPVIGRASSVVYNVESDK